MAVKIFIKGHVKKGKTQEVLDTAYLKAMAIFGIGYISQLFSSFNFLILDPMGLCRLTQD